MADEKDAAPTRVGQAVTPTVYIMGGLAPDGRPDLNRRIRGMR